MCRMRGIFTVATVCDHIEHRGDNATFWTGPFQSLCATCHNSTKQRMEKGGTVDAFTSDGRVVW